MEDLFCIILIKIRKTRRKNVQKVSIFNDYKNNKL